MIDAYPLTWPEGWPRTRPASRKRGGSSAAMAELNVARDDGLRAAGVRA